MMYRSSTHSSNSLIASFKLTGPSSESTGSPHRPAAASCEMIGMRSLVVVIDLAKVDVVEGGLIIPRSPSLGEDIGGSSWNE